MRLGASLPTGYLGRRRVSAEGCPGIAEQFPWRWDANCLRSTGVVATRLMTGMSSENTCPQATARPDQAPPMPSILPSPRLPPLCSSLQLCPLLGHPCPVPGDGTNERWGQEVSSTFRPVRLPASPPHVVT